MKKLLLILCLFLCVQNSFSQAGWSVPAGSPVASRFEDVNFVDSLIGYACGILNDGKTTLVVKTIDGGEHWDTVLIIPDRYPRSIEFMDKNIGVLGTLDTGLYRTIDGGATWSRIDSLVPGPIDGICGLSRADSNTIYGVGLYASPAYVIKSTDKGETWTYTDMSAQCGALVDVKFFSADTGFISGYGPDHKAIILYTINGGQSWEVKANVTLPTSYVWKLDFPDRLHAYASIEQWAGNPPYFLRSNDGGLSWEMKPIGTNIDHGNMQGVGFINASKGWAGGHFVGMYETQDGGDTWQHYNFGETFNRFVKLTDKKAIFSGDRLYKYDGTNVFVGNAKGHLTEFHCISNLYPFPANDQLTISYEISQRTLVTMGLYDINGKFIKPLVRSVQTKGEYEITTDVSGLTSGEYMIMMKTHERHLAKIFNVMH